MTDFLRLNGWVIPIRSDSADENTEEIGSRMRSFDGTLMRDRRTTKRILQDVAGPLTEMKAMALRGLLLGAGHSWAFDSDLFSGKGLSFGSTVGAVRIATAADGDPIVNEAAISESQFGAGSLAVEPATTNILTANQSNAETDTTGFTALSGAILAVDTGEQVEGLQSLKATTNAVDEGFEVRATATGGLTYSASVYVKTDSSRSIQINLTGDTGLANSTTQITMAPNIWYRVPLTLTLDGTDVQAVLEVTEDNAGGGDFWIDQIQVEQNDFATTWVVGQGSRAVGSLEYSPSFLLEATDMTVSAWVKMPTANTSATRTIINIAGAGTDNRFRVTREASANAIRFQTRAETSNENLTYSASPWDGAWHLVTCVMRKNPEFGEFEKTIYFDGVSVATVSTPILPDLSKLEMMEVGNRNDSLHLWPGLQDDLQVLPYAATAEQVLGWFNFGFAVADLPRLFVDGDVVPNSPGTLQVEGEVGKMPHLDGVQLEGDWRENARDVEFTLEQV